MAVSDTVIDSCIKSLGDKIKILQPPLTLLQNLQTSFITIKMIKERVLNETGGYDNVDTIPNRDNLSDTDLATVRQIKYDDFKKRFDDLNL